MEGKVNAYISFQDESVKKGTKVSIVAKHITTDCVSGIAYWCQLPDNSMVTLDSSLITIEDNVPEV